MAASAAVEDICLVPAETIEKAIQDQEEEYDDSQLFEEHEALHRRLGKSLYYGGSESSSVDRLSLPLTEICVDHFNRVIDIHDDDDRLDVSRAAQVSRETCASPTSLVLALLYLERLRGSNPGYLAAVSSADLFLVSLMVASKYLHDDGEEDEVFNEEWANSGEMTKAELNQLEIEFLSSIDWRLHVAPAEFEKMAATVETAVTKKQVSNRHWEDVTYTDLLVLSRNIKAKAVWDHFVGLTLKVTTVVVAAYAASLTSMIASCHLLNQVELGPSAIGRSLNTIYSSVGETKKEQPPVVDPELTFIEQKLSNDTADFCLHDCELPHHGTAPLPSRCPFKVYDVMDAMEVLSHWHKSAQSFPVDPGDYVLVPRLRDEIQFGTSMFH